VFPGGPCHRAFSAVGNALQISLSVLNWISVLLSTRPTTLYLASDEVQSTIFTSFTGWAVVVFMLSPARQLPTFALTGSFLALLKANTLMPTQAMITNTITPPTMPRTFPAPPFLAGGGTGPPG